MKERKWALLASTVLVSLVLSTSCKKEGYILPVKPTKDSKKASENDIQLEEASQTVNAVSDNDSELNFQGQNQSVNLGACESVAKDNPDIKAIATCSEVIEKRNGGKDQASGDTTAADLCIYRDLSTKDVFILGQYERESDDLYDINIKAKQSFKTKSFNFKDGKTRLEYMEDEELITLRRKAKLEVGKIIGEGRDRVNALIHCDIFQAP